MDILSNTLTKQAKLCLQDSSEQENIKTYCFHKEASSVVHLKHKRIFSTLRQHSHCDTFMLSLLQSHDSRVHPKI
jgi:hypothetical protein